LLPEFYHPLNQSLTTPLSHAWRHSRSRTFYVAVTGNKKTASGGSVSVS
jgi:hypothetical protein